MADDGAVAIVTGGSCGAGREHAVRLGRRGDSVVVVYLRNQRGADAVVDEILAGGGTALTIRADLTDELDVRRIFDETQAAFGTADLVVHAATAGASLVRREAAARGVAVTAP